VGATIKILRLLKTLAILKIDYRNFDNAQIVLECEIKLLFLVFSIKNGLHCTNLISVSYIITHFCKKFGYFCETARLTIKGGLQLVAANNHPLELS